jgi:hypothetical protein
MYDAFLSGPVQGADGFENSFFGIGFVLCKSFAGGGNCGTGGTAKIAILNTALLVLTIAFDL